MCPLKNPCVEVQGARVRLEPGALNFPEILGAGRPFTPFPKYSIDHERERESKNKADLFSLRDFHL